MELQIFKNEQFGEVRTTEVNKEIYFNLKDCCQILDIKNSKDVVKKAKFKGGSYYRPPYKRRSPTSQLHQRSEFL